MDAAGFERHVPGREPARLIHRLQGGALRRGGEALCSSDVERCALPAEHDGDDVAFAAHAADDVGGSGAPSDVSLTESSRNPSLRVSMSMSTETSGTRSLTARAPVIRSTKVSVTRWSHDLSSSCFLARSAPTTALIAVHILASASGSNEMSVLHIPVWRSTQRRTLRCCSSWAWRDTPSSPDRIRSRSRHSRENVSTGILAAEVTSASSRSPSSARPLSSIPRTSPATASTCSADTVPDSSALRKRRQRVAGRGRRAAVSASRADRRPWQPSSVAGDSHVPLRDRSFARAAMVTRRRPANSERRAHAGRARPTGRARTRRRRC